MDSTLTYLYQQAAGTGSAHDPYDASFVPEPPTTDYAIRKRDYHYADFGRQMHIEMRPNADSNFVTKIYKDKDFNDTLIISADNDTTKYGYKTYLLNDTIKYSSNPAKIKYPNGDSVLYYYHAPDANAPSFFLLDSTIDELSRKTAYFYDNNYNLDSLRYIARYVAGVGTTNITTDYTYNSKGNLTQLKDALGNATCFSYAPNDTGPYLTQTRIDFSPSGQGLEDIVTKYRYNTDIGKIDTLIYFKDYPGDSNIINYTYDAMNRLREIYHPDGTRDVFTYDKRGNLLKKETFSKTTNYFLIVYKYDARDRLVKVKEYKNLEETEAAYDTTLYEYSLGDNLISFFNANDTTGISTEIKYTYDADRLVKVDYPDTTNDSLGYYKDTNLKFKRDRTGKVIAYVYDKKDRLTRKRYFNSFAAYQGFPDSVPAETLAFSYDQVGNMISMVDKNGTISYSYDGMDGIDTLNCYQNLIIAYEYDKAGNKKKLKVVKASDTSTVFLEQSYLSYDEANRLKNTAVSIDTFDFKYWDTGPIKEIGYPNGIKEKYWLTNRNFIDSMKTINPGPPETQLFKFAYKYNEVGNRDTLIFYLSRPVASALSGTISYDYDDIRRITQAIYPRSIYAKTNKYTYDKVGNRLRKIAGTDTTIYTYNKRNNQLQTEGTYNFYDYDNNGNMIEFNYSGGVDKLLFDFENRLTRYVKQSNTIPPTLDTLWFSYCGLGKRISKIEKLHGQSPDTISYVYDGIYAACEFGGHLDPLSKYVYANGVLLARYDESPADTHYYHHDGLGSITGMTDESKSVEQSYFYDEFGNSLGSWGNVGNHYLYTGQEYDGSTTQLYNLRARYYKSSIGRFISEDPKCQTGIISSIECQFPVHNVGTFSLSTPSKRTLYVFALNNPVNFRDPTGLSPELPVPINPLCLIEVRKALDLVGRARNDLYKHCYVGCTIFRFCGPEYCISSGWLKELYDIGIRIRGGKAGVELVDVLATLAGCACGALPLSCEYCCKCIMGYDPDKQRR